MAIVGRAGEGKFVFPSHNTGLQARERTPTSPGLRFLGCGSGQQATISVVAAWEEGEVGPLPLELGAKI